MVQTILACPWMCTMRPGQAEINFPGTFRRTPGFRPVRSLHYFMYVIARSHDSPVAWWDRSAPHCRASRTRVQIQVFLTWKWHDNSGYSFLSPKWLPVTLSTFSFYQCFQVVRKAWCWVSPTVCYLWPLRICHSLRILVSVVGRAAIGSPCVPNTVTCWIKWRNRKRRTNMQLALGARKEHL